LNNNIWVNVSSQFLFLIAEKRLDKSLSTRVA